MSIKIYKTPYYAVFDKTFTQDKKASMAVYKHLILAKHTKLSGVGKELKKLIMKRIAECKKSGVPIGDYLSWYRIIKCKDTVNVLFTRVIKVGNDSLIRDIADKLLILM